MGKKSISILIFLFLLILSCSNNSVATTKQMKLSVEMYEDIIKILDLEDSGLLWKDKNRDRILQKGEISGGDNFLLFKDKRNSLILDIDKDNNGLSSEDYYALIKKVIEEDDVNKIKEFNNYKLLLKEWDDGFDPLFYSVEKSKIEILKEILDLNSDLSRVNQVGETPLFTAISNKNQEVLKLLLEKGSDLNHQSDKGETPLIRSVLSKNYDAIEKLLKLEVDESIMDNMYKSAAMYSHILEDKKSISLLKKPGEYILEVPVDLQDSDLTCEASSAGSAVEYFNIPLPTNPETGKPYKDWEMYFATVIESHPNPHIGFRGDIWGKMSTHHTIKNKGYGVYAEPIAKEINKLGLKAEVRYSLDYDELEADIRKGNPVVTWVSAQKSKARDLEYEGKKFRVVYGEHAWVVVGVRGEGSQREFLVNHSYKGIQVWKKEMARWSDFRNDKGEGGMKVVVSLHGKIDKSDS